MRRFYFNKDTFKFLSKVNKHKISYTEICLISVILLISAFLFFWNVEKEYLLREDELYLSKLINQSIINLLKNYKENSSAPYCTVLPIAFLSKIFFFINSFPFYRYITSFYSVIGVLIAYITVRMITKSYFKAFLASLVFSTNKFIVFISRLFLPDALMLMFTSLVIYFYFKWYRSKKTIYLISMLTFLAIDIYNNAATFYLAIPLLLWLLLLAFTKRLKLKQFVITIFIFILLMVPMAFMIYDGYKKDLWFIEKRYYMSGLEYSGIDPTINLSHFNDIFLKNLGFIFIRANPQLFLILLLLTFISYATVKITDENRFLIFMSISIFILMLLSPIVANSPTQFIPFFILFIFSLFQNLEFRAEKLFFIIVILFIFILCFIDINQISADNYVEFESKIPRTNNLIAQTGYYDVFNYLGYGKKYNLTHYDCSNSEFQGIIGNETFDKLNQFSTDDIIFAQKKWCNTANFDDILGKKLDFIAYFDDGTIYRVK